MRLRVVITALIAMFSFSIVSGCGNKGDLYRIPDEIGENDLNVLDEALEGIDAQTLESTGPLSEIEALIRCREVV